MRVLVCGGRNFNDHPWLNGVLDRMHAKIGFTVLMQGEARGADTLAKRWAISAGVPVLSFRADWGRLGNAAGPVRNQRMLDQGKPQLVIAFPGGSGTANMMSIARMAGVEVLQVVKNEKCDMH